MHPERRLDISEASEEPMLMGTWYFGQYEDNRNMSLTRR